MTMERAARAGGEPAPRRTWTADVASAAPVRRVMHLVDTLDLGGAERVAVNVVNALPRSHYQVSLCTTRRDGPLSELVAHDVMRLRLNRTRAGDPKAILRLARFVRRHRIELLHAHATALFIARLVSRLPPFPTVVWHDHFGRFLTEQRPRWLFRLATHGIGGVIAVNEPLAEWSRRSLAVPADRVWYLPNFVPRGAVETSALKDDPALPGRPDRRILCVANFRPQKDHGTLLAAMTEVVRVEPEAHLLLAGERIDGAYVQAIRRQIEDRRLESHVTVLGPRRDIPALLRACAVGVLSSVSEGLPLALIEYGASGLPAVATSVGQCPQVLDHGRAGVLVPPGAPDALASALLSLLASPSRRDTLGARFRRHVEAEYGQAQAVRRIGVIYDRVLGAA